MRDGAQTKAKKEKEITGTALVASVIKNEVFRKFLLSLDFWFFSSKEKNIKKILKLKKKSFKDNKCCCS